jgi:DNA-binding SARP family transcriptional activator
MSNTAHLRVYLFGTFRLYRNGAAVAAGDWHTRQARQLFKLLLAARGRIVPAARLAQLLWPEHSEHAHQTLRSAISTLRSVLEPERDPRRPSRFIPRGRAGYRLVIPADCALWVDVEEFESLLEQASGSKEPAQARAMLRTALRLYSGDYLAEDGDAPWVLAERSRLRERYFSAVLRLMELEIAAGACSEAIALGRQALAIDPCRELLYRLIMQCQLRLGDRGAALQTFAECRRTLHRLLGAEPAPETLALRAEILRPSAQPAPPAGSTSGSGAQRGGNAPRPILPFIGRRAELQRLTRWLESWERHRANERRRSRGQDDQHAQASVMALVGEAGVGKTSLGRRFLRHARARGFTVLATTCQALERDMAFAPIAALLKSWLNFVDDAQLSHLPRLTLARLALLVPTLLRRLPDLEPPPSVAPDQDYSLLIAALVDLFSTLREEQPLLLACDDLQWADPSTLLLLNQLAQQARRRAGYPLLLLIAYRPEDLSENARLGEVVQHLSRSGLLVALPLQRFTLAEVTTYLRACQVTSSLSPDQLYQATRGNPLFLREAVQTLRTLQEQEGGQSAAHADKEAVLASLLRSRQIRDIVLARVEQLPPRARALLELAAVIARPCPPHLLSAPAAAPAPSDYEALELLVARGFLVEQGRAEEGVTLALSHEVLGQVVYAACSELKRAHLHRQAAAALERACAGNAQAHAAEIAYHYARAGDDADPQTLHYALLAAEYARRTFSYQQALTHYDMALRLLQRMRARGLETLESEDWLGRIYEGRLLVYETLLDWEGIQASQQQLSAWASARRDLPLAEDSARRLIIARSLMGYLGEALEMGRALMERLRRESRAVAQLPEGIRRRLRLLEDMTRRWALLLTLDEALPLPTAAQRSRERQSETALASYPPFRPAPPPPIRDWQEVSTLFGDGQAASTLTTYGWALLLQGRNAEAARCLGAALEAAERSGQVASWILSAMHLSRVHYLEGAYEESERQMRACLARCRQVPEASWTAVWPLLNLAYARISPGRLDEAEHLLLQVQRQLQALDLPAYRYSTQIGLGLVALARGRIDEAEALLSASLAQRREVYIEVYVLARLALGDIARLRGSREEARRHYLQMLAFCGARSLLLLYCLAALSLARLELKAAGAAHDGREVKALLTAVHRHAREAGYVEIVEDCQQLLAGLYAPPASRTNNGVQA